MESDFSRGYTKFDFTVDEDKKGLLNLLAIKKEKGKHRRRKVEN